MCIRDRCKCASKSQAPEVNLTMGGFQRCGSELQHLSQNQECGSEKLYICDNFNIPGLGVENCAKKNKYCGKEVYEVSKCKKTTVKKDCYNAQIYRGCNKERNL